MVPLLMSLLRQALLLKDVRLIVKDIAHSVGISLRSVYKIMSQLIWNKEGFVFGAHLSPD